MHLALAGTHFDYQHHCCFGVVGIAGGAGPNHSLADMGVTTGELYNYSQPEGQRWSTVADSQIQRLYHAVAVLTSNADVGHLCIALAAHVLFSICAI